MKKFVNSLLSFAETVILSVFTASLLLTYILRPVTVSGDSMLPTLTTGDNILVAAFYGSIENGDIIIADCRNAVLLSDENTPEIRRGLEKDIVKRVIAKAGQQVDIDFEKGLVYVDGTLLNEPYISGLTHLDGGSFTGRYPVEVPEGCFFVMGDNRAVSRDSRDSAIGFVAENEIIGKAFLRIYPFDDIKFF